MFYLKTLGELSLHASGPKGPPLLRNSKPLAVLAYLATMPDHSARRDHLAQLLWPESDGNHARSSLRQALHYISQRVGRPLVRASDSIISLDDSLLDVDVWEFDRELEKQDYDHAVELYAGPFVPGLERKAGAELEEWIESEDERLRAGLDVAYTRLVGDAMARGWPSTAVEYGRLYVELNPLNEVAQLAYVRALKAAGDQVGALRSYRSYRSLLREALHDEPSDELERAIASVRDEVLKEPSLEDMEASGLRVRRRVVRWAVVGAGLGAVASVAAITLAMVLWRPGPDDPFDRLEGVIHARVGAEFPMPLARVEYSGTDAQAVITGYGHYDLPSPDGSLIASTTEAPDGRNLVVIDVASGERRLLTSRPQDEIPIGWSPDGRNILYREGVLSPDGSDYNWRLMAYDLAAGAERLITDLHSRLLDRAAWSPDGLRIAFVATPAGNADIFVIGLDGEEAIQITRDESLDVEPAWSPDGRTLGFASNRGGNYDIYTIHPDGSGLRQVTRSPAAESGPVWLSDRVLGFLRLEDDGEGDIWVTDLESMETQRLTLDGGFANLIDISASDRSPAWLDRLTISPAPEIVSPGQYLRFDVSLADASGREVSLDGMRIDWSVANSNIASFIEPQLLQVHDVGETQLVASASGWIADTLKIVSRDLVEGPTTLLLYEDWSRGIRTERWIRFGDPLPYSRSTGGPEGAGFFVSNGDYHFPSGVVSRQSFVPSNGLTIECWARLPFTGKLYQSFDIGLVGDDLPEDSTDWLSLNPIVNLDILGRNRQTGELATMQFSGRNVLIPFPPDTDSWHRYALQLDSDGSVSFIRDGQLYWREPQRLAVDELPHLHIVLGYRSEGTELAHGLLRVYYGSKYLLPDAAASGSLSQAR